MLRSAGFSQGCLPQTRLEDLVEPIQGLFADTLSAHRARIGQIALLHLDGDWYHSTREILHNLFDAVSVGAPLQVDDYGFWDGCKRAIVEFQHERDGEFQAQGRCYR